jgi:predicted nucleic acid-binding protein
MADVFADTSGWAHLIDASETYHHQAAQITDDLRSQGRKLITSNYVITELVAVLHSPLRVPRQTVIAFVEAVKTSPSVEVIHIDEALDSEAWELLKARPDKTWSLVDCASFILMRRMGILEALTADHHFEQAGFVRLLNP